MNDALSSPRPNATRFLLRAEWIVFVAVLVMVAGTPFPAASQEPGDDVSAEAPRDAVEAYRQAMAAHEAGDIATYVERMELAEQMQPGHPVFLRHLAQGEARLGHYDAAFAYLGKALEVGGRFDLDAYEDLAPLREQPEWAAFERRREQLAAPSGEEVARIVTTERDLVPEGVAYDPREDVFYLGSVAQRKIVRLARDGTTRDFIATGQDGFLCGLGIHVDPARRRLWACSSAFSEVGSFEPADRGRAAVHCYDLDSGHLVRKLVLERDGDHDQNFNDLVVGSTGEVYVTNPLNGAIYRIAPGADSLEVFLPPGSIPGANGIALDADETVLYVSKYALGIVRVDLTTRAVEDLARGDSIATCGVDGLYAVDGDLLAVQNMAGLDRVTRFHLDPAGREILGCDVLIARQPVFVDPTTGVVVGDRFYFIANSQVSPYLERNEPAAGSFGTVTILGLQL